MGLDMRTKRAVVKEMARRYQRANKKGKGRILEELVNLTGYNRGYASWLLRHCGQKVVMRGKGGRIRISFFPALAE